MLDTVLFRHPAQLYYQRLPASKTMYSCIIAPPLKTLSLSLSLLSLPLARLLRSCRHNQLFFRFGYLFLAPSVFKDSYSMLPNRAISTYVLKPGLFSFLLSSSSKNPLFRSLSLLSLFSLARSLTPLTHPLTHPPTHPSVHLPTHSLKRVARSLAR